VTPPGTRSLRTAALVTTLLGCALVTAGVQAAHAAGGTLIGPGDWPMYGHDLNRDFAGITTINQTSAHTLAPAWFFPTGDAVTAQPIVVAGAVYVGSWDGNFYAINAATGTKLWSRTLDPQPAVKPVPGNRQPGDATSDGGIVTSTAFFEPGDGLRPDLVIFGGGFTLYALRAVDGTLYWKHVYSGKPEAAPDPNNDSARIFSSPAVVGNHVLFSVSADGVSGYRGYMVSADLASGNPQWIRELDGTDMSGAPLNDGCGNVWGSPTIEAGNGIEVVGTADCQTRGTTSPHAEHVLGVNIGDGSIAWEFVPPRLPPNPGGTDPACDFDFGATPNLGTDGAGHPTFLGVGGKDGTYYSLNPAHPDHAPLWSTNVVFGGSSGGFLGSAAYDGTRAYGATAFGDFSPGSPTCEPTNPNDTMIQEPSLHAFTAASGGVAWQQMATQSFGPTSVAGGMVFVGADLIRRLAIFDAASGTPVTSIPGINSDSGVVVSGNALFVGTGSSDQGSGDGVFAFTPLGVAPTTGGPGANVPEWPAGGAVLATGLAVTVVAGRVRRRRETGTMRSAQ
jgi:polyvinyl alcohol dehydrogenase (cytochrome)